MQKQDEETEIAEDGGWVPRCMYCCSKNGHAEDVVTDDPYLGSVQTWFCCHDCRDTGMPCETFGPPDKERQP